MAARSGRPLAAVAAGDIAQFSVHVGRQLRRLRHDHGWSIDAAAAKAGLSRNTLGGLETQQLPNPTLSTLLALMELYGVRTIEELLGVPPSRSLLQAWVQAGRPGQR